MNITRTILVAALAVGVPAAAQNPNSVASDGLATIRVATRSTRPISPTCVYSSQVEGTLRSRPDGAALNTVRDANLRTVASIACDGRVVVRHAEHLVLPASNVAQVNANLEKGLTVAMPGRHCLYSVATRLDHGRLVNDHASNLCKASRSPLMDNPVLARRPLSDEARSGAH